MESKWKLFKVDRNGTEYYANYACPHCGGAGGLDEWTYTGYTCWECGGSGIASKPQIWKKYTPEYEAKLAARRQAKMAAKLEQEKEHADEANAVFFQQQGFNADGKTWVVLGNTFEIKDELKQLGCKYTGILGWHTDHPLDGYDMLMLDVSECFDKDYAGIYRWQQWKNDGLEEKIKDASAKAAANRSKSQHVGKVGDRISIKAKLTDFRWYETQFGDMNIYTFTDIFNNVFVWKTKAYLERNIGDILKPVRKGEMVELKATIKDHDEYQGIKQTVLTRCKVIA